MRRAPPRLGPFDLLEPIGRGGMGEVWRGLHREQQLVVAVKVLTAQAARQEPSLRDFRNEVRAVAGLDHPNVIHLLDSGEIDPDAEVATGGRLVAGSPYLVMEFASLGSLAQSAPPTSWSGLSTWLFSLLDALAHAHARGVIHRDLKPGNVLLCGPDDPRPGLKLSDFGISFLSETTAQSSVMRSVAGTLRYMSPEQIQARFRDYGPWTDLYALGCMAWRYSTGEAPFNAKDAASLLRAHARSALPEFTPRLAVPTGLRDWLGSLLAKDPADRFQRAADAAAALRALDQPAEEAEPAPGEDEPELTHWSVPRRMSLSTLSMKPHEEETVELAPPAQPAPQPTERRRAPIADARAPIPRDWRQAGNPAPMPLLGAGRALQAVRRHRLAGRVAERDRLWKSLLDVATGRRLQIALVRGPSGTGKSRLAEWLGHRAHELGAATILRGDATGLARMLSSYLRCTRLDDRRLTQRLRHRYLDTSLVEDLSAMLGQARGQLAPAAAREITCRTLRAEAHGRPLVVLLDDVQWAPDLLELALDLGHRHRRLPALVVVCAQDEALADRPYESSLVARLTDLADVDLQLGPLDEGASHELIRDMLRLEGPAAALLGQRAGGNPLFAVELVRDWLRRDLLVAGPHGFRLRGGASGAFPDGLHEMWSARLDAVLDGLPDEARAYLECAAAIGPEVADDLWHEAADAAWGVPTEAAGGGGRVALSLHGLRMRARLTDRLVAARLAEETDDGWAFVHGMLRETLARAAKEGGRWERYHRACAAVLQRRADRGEPISAERLGRHLRDAGDATGAIEPLLAALTERERAGGVRAALALLPACDEALRAAGVSQADPRQARLWLARAQLSAHAGERDDAVHWARAVVSVGDRPAVTGWGPALQAASLVLAACHLDRRDAERASARLDAARSAIVAAADPAHLGELAHLDARVAWVRGATREATDRLRVAAASFRRAGMRGEVALCLATAARIASDRGDHTQGIALLRRAIDAIDPVAHHAALASCRTAEGDVHRRAGATEPAAEAYQRAIDGFDAAGCPARATGAHVGLALTRLAQGAAADALGVLEAAWRRAERHHDRDALVVAHLALVEPLAVREDWGRAEHHVRRAVALAAETGRCDVDIGELAERAGDLCASRRPECARLAYALAATQWRDLDHADRAAHAEALSDRT